MIKELVAETLMKKKLQDMQRNTLRKFCCFINMLNYKSLLFIFYSHDAIEFLSNNSIVRFILWNNLNSVGIYSFKEFETLDFFALRKP